MHGLASDSFGIYYTTVLSREAVEGPRFYKYKSSFVLYFLVSVTSPQDIQISRLESDITMMNVSWRPLSLVEAKGFVDYIITLQPDNNRKRQTLTAIVPGSQSSTIIQIDPVIEYEVSVGTVTTSSGEMGPGEDGDIYAE